MFMDIVRAFEEMLNDKRIFNLRFQLCDLRRLPIA